MEKSETMMLPYNFTIVISEGVFCKTVSEE